MAAATRAVALCARSTRTTPAGIETKNDVHTVWLNREAMARLGVRTGGDELPWGRPELDPETGEPTGWIHDFAVRGIAEHGQRALAQHLPGFSPDAAYERLVASLDMAARFGITTV